MKFMSEVPCRNLSWISWEHTFLWALQVLEDKKNSEILIQTVFYKKRERLQRPSLEFGSNVVRCCVTNSLREYREWSGDARNAQPLSWGHFAITHENVDTRKAKKYIICNVDMQLFRKKGPQSQMSCFVTLFLSLLDSQWRCMVYPPARPAFYLLASGRYIR